MQLALTAHQQHHPAADTSPVALALRLGTSTQARSQERQVYGPSIEIVASDSHQFGLVCLASQVEDLEIHLMEQAFQLEVVEEAQEKP